MADNDCPSCASPLTGGQGFVKWCRECGWNVAGARDTHEPTLTDRTFTRLQRRRGPAVLTPEPRIRTLLSRIVIYIISLATILLNPFLVVLGIWMIRAPDPNALRVSAGGLIVFLALFTMPWPRRNYGRVRVSHLEAPALHELLDAVAAGIGVRKPRRVYVDLAVNASVHRTMLHGTAVSVGAPLWWLLQPQQRVAVVAHEMAHIANGDPLQGMLVRAARGCLARWYGAFGQARVRTSFMVLVSPLSLVVRWILRTIMWLLVALGFTASQRAELRADAMAAEVAGSDATIAALRRVQMGGRFAAHLRTCRERTFESEARLWLQAVPATEWERLERLAGQEVDFGRATTHPPSGVRLATLEQHQRIPEGSISRNANWPAIDAELSDAVPKVLASLAKRRRKRRRR